MNPAEQTMILVVEDDETVASSVVSALRDQRGMHVQRSANLAEAERVTVGHASHQRRHPRPEFTRWQWPGIRSAPAAGEAARCQS
jgi:hypothetical protein